MNQDPSCWLYSVVEPFESDFNLYLNNIPDVVFLLLKNSHIPNYSSRNLMITYYDKHIILERLFKHMNPSYRSNIDFIIKAFFFVKDNTDRDMLFDYIINNFFTVEIVDLKDAQLDKAVFFTTQSGKTIFNSKLIQIKKPRQYIKNIENSYASFMKITKIKEYIPEEYIKNNLGKDGLELVNFLLSIRSNSRKRVITKDQFEVLNHIFPNILKNDTVYEALKKLRDNLAEVFEHNTWNIRNLELSNAVCVWLAVFTLSLDRHHMHERTYKREVKRLIKAIESNKGGPIYSLK